MTRPSRPSGLQFSLRSLLAVIAFVAVACVALKYAGALWWSILSGASLLLFMAVVIVAFVGSQEQRALAVGYSLCIVIYGALLFLAGTGELDPGTGRMPTTMILRPLFESIVSGKWIDLSTGQEVPPPSTTGGAPSMTGGGYGSGGMLNPGAAMVGYAQSPDQVQFMSIGHLLWAELLGIAGAVFAGWVYRRREQRPLEQ